MRKEASLEQWKILYESATRIKELKPWENFWDLDLIGVIKDDDEDSAFLQRSGKRWRLLWYSCLRRL